MASVDLSSINRAAFAAKEGYWWINGIALALSCVIANMSWAAYTAPGVDDPQRAVACIMSQAVAIAAAVLARRASTGQMSWAAVGAIAIAVGCAWWASHGIALAWYDDQERNGEPMVLFLAALEPALFLLAEHIKEGRQALRVAQERDDRETAEALAAARLRDEANRQKPPAQPVDDRQPGETARIYRLKPVETARQPADLPGEPGDVLTADRLAGDSPVEELPRLTAPDHSAGTFKDAEAHARHLITVEGVRHRNELARQVRGLSTYKAARLLDELAPGWRAKTAAA